MSSALGASVDVGSVRAAGKRYGYGPAMLIERFEADPDPFAPIWTTLGGVLPRGKSVDADGELFRMILIAGALLGVSKPALLAFSARLGRDNSTLCSCLGSDVGTGASFSNACVTFENLIAGGGSSSESLSLRSMRCNIGASARKPCMPFEIERGEFRRICGRPGCATAAMISLILRPKRRVVVQIVLAPMLGCRC